MTLREHYLQKARAYKDSVERQDNKPIDDDPARQVLLLAIMDADDRHHKAMRAREDHELQGRRQTRIENDTEDELSQLLDALLSLKPPFPGLARVEYAEPSIYADKSVRPGLNKPTEDAANV